MTRAEAPVASLNALPLELCLLIALESVADSDHDPRDVVRLTHIDARMRDLVVNTSELWNKFMISSSKSSHKLGLLFVLRSGERALDLLLSPDWPTLRKRGLDSFSECFMNAAPRIARLSVYIKQQSSLYFLNYLLGRFELPLLEHIEVNYDNEEHQGFTGCISLPPNGANLRSISLTRVQTEPFCRLDLNKLTYIYLEAGERWKWMNLSLISFLQAATSLQELHLVGEQGVFRTSTDDGFEVMPLTLPALRRVCFINTAPNLITSFLHKVDVPLLEEVELTTPTHRNQEEEVIGAWKRAARVTMRNPLLALPVRTLTVRNADVMSSNQDLCGFVLFLMVMFPHVTTLEAEAVFVDILRICIALADKQPLGRPLVWMGVETLKVCGHVDHEMEEVYGKVVGCITDSLQTLKEKGVMNLQELRLSVDPSLQPPAGTVSIEALSGLVGKLILDDYWLA